MGAPQATGTVVRGYVAQLRRRPYWEELRTRASPTLRAILDEPPFPLRWVDAGATRELLELIATLRNRDEVRDVVRASTTVALGPLLKPVVRSTLSLFGGGPSSLFANMGTLCAPILRGTAFVWTPEGKTAGVMVLRHEDPTPDALYAAWEGSFVACLSVGKQKGGTVSQTRVSEGGRVGTVQISWG